jgi:hypothetical protein
MKKNYALLSTLLLLSVTFKASAQSNNDDFSNLIRSSPADVTKLFQAYGKPMFKGFGVGLNSGWNNTAKTKKFLHFEIRFSAAAALPPSSDKSFDINSLGLSNRLRVAPGSTSIAPTFAGDKDAATPTINTYSDSGTPLGNFSMPKGVIKFIPASNVQATIGLPKNTDLTVRYFPKTKVTDDVGSIGTFGFGIKHNIIQDFVKKGIPKPFDLALAFNYNRIDYSKALDVQRPTGTTGPNADFSNQKIDANFSAIYVQAIISKRFAVVTPFASVGYQTSTSKYGVLGNYPIQSGLTSYTIVTDPVNVKETSLSGIRGDIGLQLELAILRVYASVSQGGGYTSGNAGIGFSF